MTHDYKAALDGMVDGRAGVGDWFITHKDAIRQALTLAAEHERVKKERDELADALKEYYIMYGDRSIISSVDDLLEKAGILND